MHLSIASKKSPNMPKKIVDQNMLNSSETGLGGCLARDPELRIVIPDVAFVEMCKGPEWELTMKLALREVAPYVDRAEMSWAVGEALELESNTTRPVKVSELTPPAFQVVLRGLIRDLADDAPPEAKRSLRARVGAVHSEVAAELLDADEAKKRAGTLAQTWREALAPEIIKAAGSSKTDAAYVSALIQVEADALAFHFATHDLGMLPGAATEFVAAKPMILRHLLANVRYSLLAAQRGPIALERTRAAKELNNKFDLEYGILATYFDGLLTNDKQAMQAYSELREMLDRPVGLARQIREEFIAGLGLYSRS